MVRRFAPECESANNVEIVNLAKFAVEEHNKNENAMLRFEKVVTEHRFLIRTNNAMLRFERVVSARSHSVEGRMCYIRLEAADGDQKKVYEAKIWVRLWLNFKQLLEFKLRRLAR